MQPRAFLASLEQFGVKLGLEQIRRLLAALDHPERACPAITVAGTNGKGSVTAMLERGLRAAGFRTGRYTSPHLIHLEERFALDGRPVLPAALDAALARVAAAAAPFEHLPTYFEATTAAALLLFAGHRADVSVLEVGLGGRLDATNAVDAVAVVVTAIDLDHQQLLGPTIDAIAREKAAVIKPGSLVVAADNRPDVLDVIRGRCRQVGAELVMATADVSAQVDMADGRVRLQLSTPVRHYADLTLALRGRHQAANAIAAIRMLELLDAHGIFPVPEAAIRTAVEDVVWPGRLEPLTIGGTPVLLDGAHNEAGAAALAAYVREAIGRPVPLVFGVLRDKDVDAVADRLASIASCVVCTAPDSPRAVAPDDLAAVVSRVASPGVAVDVDPSPAAAIARAAGHGTPVVVAGSLFLAGEVRALAGRDVAKP